MWPVEALLRTSLRGEFTEVQARTLDQLGALAEAGTFDQAIVPRRRSAAATFVSSDPGSLKTRHFLQLNGCVSFAAVLICNQEVA